MEPEGVVTTTTNINPTNTNKNKFIVAGLFIAILVLIGAVFLFGKEQTGPRSASGPTPSIVLPTIDQALEAARTQVEINLTSNGFVPKVVTVKKGTRVIWFNKTSVDGTVSSDPHPTHQLYPPLNLGTFPPDFSVQLIFNDPGTYGYHNHFKPEQTGTIIVQ
ncbi:MAG: cupredoxin domain-containing protein [Candidatus Levybacteria bacterium]|nr:cupredoxin domain-containing protein [Candidatus Levybacteria bacterium]